MKARELSEAGGLRGAPLQCLTQPAHWILLADDDGNLRTLSVIAVAGSGYQVAACRDALQANSYDLIINDNPRRGMTEIGIIEKLR